ncbi:MAG: hypothetical protein K0R05_869 [Anaerocolumna sp.]|jgi:hypothetical protein|nr:hypothetical protein [Anaerocolumna sp.]
MYPLKWNVQHSTSSFRHTLGNVTGFKGTEQEANSGKEEPYEGIYQN